MGGGHLSRPDFGMPQPDPSHPLTEFYQLLQRGLDREGIFALPALYAVFQAPARRIYADEAADYLTLTETPAEASTPPLPDCAAALTLTLTLRDVEEADAAPRALEQRLCRTAAGKHWLTHPKAETFLAERVALLQRLYKR